MKQTLGPLYEVACPWPDCGHKNNFIGLQRDLTGEFLGNSFGGSSVGSNIDDDPALNHLIGKGLNVRDVVDCDKCKRKAVITGYQDMALIVISPIQNPKDKRLDRIYFVQNVQCPWCKKHSDWYAVWADLGSQLIGSAAECDHCKKNVYIKKVQRMPYIRLAPKA